MRRKHARNFRKYDFDEENVDPGSSMSSMSDCMLVLAVALMIALITHWNIDVTGATQIDTTDMKEVEQPVVSATGEAANGSDEFEEAGKVYRNKNTGELFIVE